MLCVSFWKAVGRFTAIILFNTHLYHFSDISQIGRRARDYCEVASRTSPTYSDVELALVDMGEGKNRVCYMYVLYNVLHNM